MKISPSMVEAGVAALARIKRQQPVDASVVAAVFSAMHSQMEADHRRMAGTTVEKKYEHQAWPAWRYGPDGEGEIFARAEDVPEGWTDTLPAIAEAIAKRRGRPPKVRADAQPPVA